MRKFTDTNLVNKAKTVKDKMQFINLDGKMLPLPTEIEISEFGNTIYNISVKYPIVYGIASIFLALVAGVAVSFIRRKISLWRSQRMNKPAMY